MEELVATLILGLPDVFQEKDIFSCKLEAPRPPLVVVDN